MSDSPILSLCIPTFNRGKFLRESLERIVSEDVFVNTNDVEIVISDNCSPDDTQQVCESFVKRFPDKIVYHRNETNTGMMANFSTMLRYGRGEFLKLQNDNSVMRRGSLKFIIDQIRENRSAKPVLFFMNGCIDGHQDEDIVIKPRNLDEYFATISILSTWLGGFCVWKDDLETVWPTFLKYWDSLEPNTPVLLQYYKIRKDARIYGRTLHEKHNALMKNKGGYNPMQAFCFNYASIMRDFMGADGLSKATYDREVKKGFWHGFWLYFDFKREHHFDKGHFIRYSRPCWFKGYFYEAIACALYNVLVKQPIQKLMRRDRSSI